MAKSSKSLPRVSAMKGVARSGPVRGMRGVNMDTLQNLVMGLATEKDKLFNTSFISSEISRDQLNAAYRSDWIARKTVDIPAYDATREWRSWQAKKEQITKIEETEKRLKVQRSVRVVQQMARLYGGAALVMGVGNNPAEELMPERVKKDGLKYVHAITRFDLNAGPTIRDPESPWYGEPEYYERTTTTTGRVRVHPSRVVRFLGAPILDEQMDQANQGWGDSILQVTSEATRAAGLVVASVAQMVAEGKMDVLSIPGFSSQLAAEGNAYSGRLTERFSTANMMKSVFSLLLIDKDEQWERISTQFTGFPDILKMYLLVASGAADIPATRMLSQSPTGLSATGDSDLRNYYDHVRVVQTTDIQPDLARLDQALLASSLGSVPDDIFYNWNPLWQMDDKEKTAISYQKAQIFQIDVNAGLLDRNVLKEARENQLIEDGLYPGFEQTLDELDGTAEEELDNTEGNDPFADPEDDPNANEPGNDNEEDTPPPARRRASDFNPHHEPGGRPTGGRFTNAAGGRYTEAPEFSEQGPQYDAAKEKAYIKFADKARGHALEDDEIAAIQFYTADGFLEVNSMLRKPGFTPDQFDAETRGFVSQLDMTTRLSELPKNVQAYRMVSKQSMEGIANAKDGDLFEDRGFTSVSANPEPLKSLKLKKDVIEVRLPKGTPATPVAHVSTNPGEQEIIVARNGIYSVRTDSSGKRYLQYERQMHQR